MSLSLTEAQDLLNAKSWQEAHDAFQSLIESGRESQNPDAVHDWAICCFYLKDLGKALRLLDHAVELQPNYGYRYASRAWMRAAAKNFEGAMEDYQRAIELDPEDAVSHNNLGLLEEQMGYRKQAQERFDVADSLQGIFEANGLESERMEQPGAAPDLPVERGTLATMWWAIKTSEGRQSFVGFLKNGLKLNK
jgi:tetratricopeptide (TPR) repeat protein